METTKFYDAVLEIAKGIFFSVEEMENNCLWIEMSKDKGFGIRITDGLGDLDKKVYLFRRKDLILSTFVNIFECGGRLLEVLEKKLEVMKNHLDQVEDFYKKICLGISYAYDRSGDDLPCIEVDLYDFGVMADISCHPNDSTWDYYTASYHKGDDYVSLKRERDIFLWIEGSNPDYQKHVIALKAEMAGLKTSTGGDRVDVEFPLRKWEFKWNDLPKNWEVLMDDLKEDIKFSRGLR